MKPPNRLTRCSGHDFKAAYRLGFSKPCKTCVRYIHNGTGTDIAELYQPGVDWRCINHIRKPRSDEGRGV